MIYNMMIYKSYWFMQWLGTLSAKPLHGPVMTLGGKHSGITWTSSTLLTHPVVLLFLVKTDGSQYMHEWYQFQTSQCNIYFS